MSETLLKLISTIPEFVPAKSNINKAKVYFAEVFKNPDTKFEETDEIQFVDPGVNFENINCNCCGQVIDIDLWGDAVDKAYEKRFTDLLFTTPCCHSNNSLNDLDYHWPAGFAKFTVIINDPSADLNSVQLTEIEQLLETKIRKVWAHY